MDMFNENVVLCASSAYEKKFYLNEAFDKLPEDIKNELKIMCVLFTEEVGGILTLEFDENGTLLFKTEADENDLLYDDIACGMLIKKLQYEKRDLLESMEMFYRVFFLGEWHRWQALQTCHFVCYAKKWTAVFCIRKWSAQRQFYTAIKIQKH